MGKKKGKTNRTPEEPPTSGEKEPKDTPEDRPGPSGKKTAHGQRKQTEKRKHQPSEVPSQSTEQRGPPPGQHIQQSTGQPVGRPPGQQVRQPWGPPPVQQVQQSIGQPVGPPPGQQVRQPWGPPPGQQVQQSTGQPVGPPPGQQVRQPWGPPPAQQVQQSTGQPVGPPPGQQVRQPWGPPPAQQVQQSIGQPVGPPPAQQVQQSTGQPVGPPPGQQVRQPWGPPPEQQVQQSTGQPVGRPPGQQVRQPWGPPPAQQVQQSIGQPVGPPPAQQVQQSTEQPVGPPPGQQVRQPWGPPPAQQVQQSTGQPVGRPPGQPVGRPPGQPVGRPPGQPVGRPPGQQVRQPWGPPPAQQVQQSIGQPVGPPPAQQVQQSAGQPVGPPPGQQIQQSAGQAVGPPPGQQIQQSAGQPVGPPPGQQIQQSAGQPVGPPPGQQIQQSAGQAVGPPPGQQIQQSTGQPVGPPPGQQIQQSAGQAVGPPPGKQVSGRKPPHKGSSSGEKEKSRKTPPQEQSRGAVVPVKFAPRIPATKRSGKPITVSTNFYPLIIENPNIVICHYDVTIEPDKPKYLIRDVWKKYMSMVFPKRLAAFDGKNAYSKGPLTDDETTVTSVTVFNEENKREKEFKVSIKEVRRVSFSCFHNFRERVLNDRSLKILPEAETSVLDIILRNWACDNVIRSGRCFFPLSDTSPVAKDLSDKLCLRLGYFQSAYLGYSTYLNFDISHKVFYKPLPVVKVFECFMGRREVDQDELNHFLRTVKVVYQLPNDKSTCRIYRINKLVGNANTQKFKKDDGSEQTVNEYFAVEKKCKLRRPDLPLLWVGPTQKSIYLPMEYCTILPDQIYRGLLTSNETREMVRNATSDARVRSRDVGNLFAKVNINSHPLMKEFGLRVAEEMTRVPARVLDPPGLLTLRNVKVKDDGTWRISNFLEPVTLKKWCILVLDRVDRQRVMNLQRLLQEKGNDFNMEISNPARDPLQGEASFAGLKKAFSQLKDMKLVFVIISEAKGLYSRVKAICETEVGVLTQCIKSRTVSQDPRKLSTTVENILLKVNAKLGGKNHSLDRYSMPQCLDGYVMVIGADVTHPSPGMNIPSVAAVTVSCDPAAFQYGTTTRVQPKGEMIRDMEEIIGIHLKKFYNIRRKYPEKIIFFRDGVSEGEMEKVLTGELAAVRKACNPYCQPKITFVVVQKRHHTRFFPTRPEDEQGRNFNVPVGTCVDSDIVHPRDLEFYLVSHASILGTARPTRYRTLYNENQLTDEEVQKLSFYLCHLFARCNRSVSYPSPTYNAHLAAARVRAYLEGSNLMREQDIARIQNRIPDRISDISPMFFV